MINDELAIYDNEKQCKHSLMYQYKKLNIVMIYYSFHIKSSLS
jgi:hypothetical protein